MFDHERQRAIVDLLAKRPSASVTEMMDELAVSRSTLRRDLVDLEERGELVRIHGGAVHPAHLRGEPSMDSRRVEAVTAKRAIAAKALEFVPEGATVYLDAGTTCLEIGRLLCTRPDLRLFTHSVPLLMECGPADCSITCIGGEYRKAGQALVGGLAMQWMRHLRVDIAFIGASGLDRDGLSTTELSEASTKSALLNQAEQCILVADRRKWQSPAAIQFATWSMIDAWVVDGPMARKGRPPVTLHQVTSSRAAKKSGAVQ